MDLVDDPLVRFRCERVESWLQAHLGPEVSVVCTNVNGDVAGLWPEERSAVLRAIPRRQREFAAGRAAARAAVRRLSGIEAPIPSNKDRSPCWPEGIVGSITHTRDTCLVVVGLEKSWRSIGIDMEPDCGIDETLWDLVCTPDERSLLRERPASEQAAWVARLFVAKEAFYKWHYPQKKTVLDFQAVSVVWCPDGCKFSVSTCGTDFGSDEAAVSGCFWMIENSLIACVATANNHRQSIPPTSS